jgi:glutamyl-tRNA(Gln) amidotransferase subunit D
LKKEKRMQKDLSGYRGRALKLLTSSNVEIGSLVEVVSGEIRYEGVLMPRYELADDEHIVVKLRNGYNIGIRIEPKTEIKEIGSGEKPTYRQPSRPKSRPDLPQVAIVSTGGTIASRVDYRTGAVRPALSAGDLYAVVPELSDIGEVKAEILFSILSENMTPRYWSELAVKIAQIIEEGTDGIVVTHGTDTLGYTAAAMSFALQNLPVPVVLVGAQRSSDRPSSDAATNLLAAVKMATGPIAEVVVAMHRGLGDDSILIHRGTKVRKCHTSRRDAFKSINVSPLAQVRGGEIEILTGGYRQRDLTRKLTLKERFEPRVALVKTYPGMDPKVIEFYKEIGFMGIVFEGTGLGHLPEECFPPIKDAISNGVIVGMTSQCIAGRVRMTVYETGMDLLSMGVIPLGDMLPETATVKMMWVLGQTETPAEAGKLLSENLVGEIAERSLAREEAFDESGL